MNHTGMQVIKPKARPIRAFARPSGEQSNIALVISWCVHGSGAVGYGPTWPEAYKMWAEHYMSAALYGTGPAPKESVLGLITKHRRLTSPIPD